MGGRLGSRTAREAALARKGAKVRASTKDLKDGGGVLVRGALQRIGNGTNTARRDAGWMGLVRLGLARLGLARLESGLQESIGWDFAHDLAVFQRDGERDRHLAYAALLLMPLCFLCRFASYAALLPMPLRFLCRFAPYLAALGRWSGPACGSWPHAAQGLPAQAGRTRLSFARWTSAGHRRPTVSPA
jgi:hypothetical protein